MKKSVLYALDTLANNGQGYFPADIRRLYNIPSAYDGTGQTIGILEFSNGYSLRDAQQFWTMHGIPSPTVDFVSIDGTPNDDGVSADDEEASLDLQWAGAIAQGATLVVYEADAGSTYSTFADALIRTLQYILNDTTHNPSVLSISYGDAEKSFPSKKLKQIADLIAELDNRGVTVCIASGDQGAYGMHDPYGNTVRHADAPATSPNAIAVGGTSLRPNGKERAWSYKTPSNGGATGGGFSAIFPAPSYQSALHAKGRGIPDVAFNADPATGYQIVFQGQTTVVGGTSVSCPVFAAIVALANQARAMKGMKPLKNLVQTLYLQSATLPFRDITVGNNSFNRVRGYEAEVGWDACTGWGSLDVAKFIDAMTGGGTTTTPQPQPQPGGGSDPSPSQPTAKGIQVRVLGVIKTVEQDAVVKGVHHHHLLLTNIEVLEVEGATGSQIGQEGFVAIRYGDSEGLPGPIPNLQAGQRIELQGEYIPKNEAYPSIGNPGDPVIHFTHHPVGFVVYQWQVYQ